MRRSGAPPFFGRAASEADQFVAFQQKLGIFLYLSNGDRRRRISLAIEEGRRGRNARRVTTAQHLREERDNPLVFCSPCARRLPTSSDAELRAVGDDPIGPVADPKLHVGTTLSAGELVVENEAGKYQHLRRAAPTILAAVPPVGLQRRSMRCAKERDWSGLCELCGQNC